MNRTIKQASVQRYHYDSHPQLKRHLKDFIAAYNFARRLKTLAGVTVYEFLCKCWQNEPQRFTLAPTHQLPGLYKLAAVGNHPSPLPRSVRLPPRALLCARKLHCSSISG